MLFSWQNSSMTKNTEVDPSRSLVIAGRQRQAFPLHWHDLLCVRSPLIKVKTSDVIVLGDILRANHWECFRSVRKQINTRARDQSFSSLNASQFPSAEITVDYFHRAESIPRAGDWWRKHLRTTYDSSMLVSFSSVESANSIPIGLL